MIFDNKPISEITDEDLTDLIGNQEENLWIEFKRKHYEGYNTKNEKYRREICKDVTAMANAEGGYILIGVDANKNNNIAQKFFDISDANDKVKSIRDTCHDRIRPPIAKLEVKPRELELPDRKVNLIIVHVPFSENRPHGFNSNGTLNFVKRYEDTIREFDTEEFRLELFADILKQRDLLSTHDNTRLDRIESQTIDILKAIGGIE
ncbi:MAG: ATP-binding protein [Candidatus Poribacteria bacterium]|nr:ATP-binding protein [Candidatus Poribacteria bacterium]